MLHHWAFMDEYQTFMDDYQACMFPRILVIGNAWAIGTHGLAKPWIIIGHSWAPMRQYWEFMGEYQISMDDYHACIFRRILASSE